MNHPGRVEVKGAAVGLPDEKGFAGLAAGAATIGEFRSRFSGNSSGISGFSLLSLLKEMFQSGKKERIQSPDEKMKIEMKKWLKFQEGIGF